VEVQFSVILTVLITTLPDDRHAFAVNYLTIRRKQGYYIGYNGSFML